VIYTIFRTRHGMSVPVAQANSIAALMPRMAKLASAFRRIAPHLPLPYHVATTARRARLPLSDENPMTATLAA
jgi:hypothetical protein